MNRAFSFSTPRRVMILAAALALAGCGGGGGGGDAPATVLPVIPLAAGFASYVNGQASYSVTYSGTAISPTGQQLPFSGSGLVNETTTASVFEGLPALRKDMTQSGQFVILGTGYPVTAASSSYFDTNYAPIGSISPDGYCVVTDYHPLPVTARPGDNAIWFSSTCYSNATRSVRIGSSSTSWVLESESDNTARFKTIVNLTDNTGASGTSNMTLRVSTTGAITRLGESGTLSQDGITMNYVGTYQ